METGAGSSMGIVIVKFTSILFPYNKAYSRKKAPEKQKKSKNLTIP